MYEVTLFPIIGTGIFSVLLGFVWYHPKVFGGTWMRLAGITPEGMARGRKTMPFMVIAGFFASMLVAYVMNYFGVAWGVRDVIGAIELGIWSWIGFVAPVMLGMVLWDQKPFRLYLIHAFYWLVAFVGMAVILVI